eukprot:364187-Chlamydomonas_euryale.AAC.13
MEHELEAVRIQPVARLLWAVRAAARAGNGAGARRPRTLDATGTFNKHLQQALATSTRTLQVPAISRGCDLPNTGCHVPSQATHGSEAVLLASVRRLYLDWQGQVHVNNVRAGD